MMTTSIILIFILSLMFIALIKPKILYYIMVFFAGWRSIFIDVGLTITVYRLIILIFLICLPVYLSPRKKAVRFPPSFKFLFIFIYYAVIITIVSQFYIPKNYILGFTRGQGRWLFQIVMLLIDVTPAFLPLLFFKKTEDIDTTAKVFVGSTIILCILGWLQSFIFYLYGIDVFPVFREGLTGSWSQAMGVDMIGMSLFRMHSLGGEPKEFAITVVVAIFLLIIAGIYDNKRLRFRNSLIIFFLISMFMSLSTSGFFVLLAGMVLIIILSIFVKGISFKFVFNSVTVITIAVIMLTVFLIAGNFLSLDSFKDLFLERTIRRSPIELFDAAVIDFLTTQPLYGLFGVGLGNIHLYAWDNLVQYANENPLARWVLKSYHNFVFVPNSGYLRIISELGIVGIILFLYAYLRPVWLNFKHMQHVHNRINKKVVISLNFLAVITLVTYLMRYFNLNYAYISLGLVYFLNSQIMLNLQHNAGRRYRY